MLPVSPEFLVSLIGIWYIRVHRHDIVDAIKYRIGARKMRKEIKAYESSGV